MELVEIDALKIVSRFVESTAVPVGDDVAAHLIVEVDGNHMETLMSEMEAISAILAEYDCGEIFLQMMQFKKQHSGNCGGGLPKL